MTDVLAAIGCAQIKNAEFEKKQRQVLIKKYIKAISNLPIKHFYNFSENIEHSAHIFPIMLIEGDRDALIEYLNNINIGTSVHYTPLHKMTFWQKFVKDESFENSDNYFKNCLSLPLYPSLSNFEFEKVVGGLNSYFGIYNAA